MFKRFVDGWSHLLIQAAKKNQRIQAAIFLAIVFPVILIGASAYFQTHQDLTELTLSRRQAVAALAAAVLKQRFDRLTDIGVSLATRVRFRQLVHDGQWEEAIQIMNSVRQDFPFIDRVFLADPNGTLMVDSPALPRVRGKNFSDRDWYQGVSKNWKPYISDGYKRAAEPQYNVIAAALPISEKEKLVGILVLQVQLNDLLEWSNLVEVGSSAFIYFVDRKGRLATHPNIPSVGKLIDYSGLSVVQKVLAGESGIEIIFNAIENEERIAAYAPVPGIGWGVIVQEPQRTAFARRDENLQRLLLRYGLIFLISCALAYLILRTVSGLKRAEEKIQTLNRDLEQRATELQMTNKELEGFSYSVSHDLRAPLRHIQGFCELLPKSAGDQLPAKAQRYIKTISASAQRMADLIDDLLTFSRMQRAEMHETRVELKGMVNEVIEISASGANGRQIDWKIASLPAVQGDPAMLRQVFVNLISNAVKYSRPRDPAVIEVGWAGEENGQHTLFVRDNGVGFDMQYAHKLFGVFQRLHSNSEFEGTGIGLANVQRIIARHGGRVWAEGEPEKGATIYFILKATEMPERQKRRDNTDDPFTANSFS
jgi:signal transduction histidine kinase